jgi:hypothetical protein
VENVTTEDKRQGPEWPDVLPPEGHPRLGQELLRIVGDVIKDKTQLGLHDKWMRLYKLARGKHWEKPGKVPQKTANLVHVHIQRTINTLTDNDPTFNVSQTGESEDDEIFTNLQLACEYWWQEQEQQAVLERSVRNGETYGITIEKVIFNPDLEYGIGEVETVVVDPYHFGVYPVKCSDLQKADVVLHFYPMSVREARRRWPEMADRIKGDGQFLDELGSERREIAGGGQLRKDSQGLFTTMGTVVKQLFNKISEAEAEGDEETLVVEAWCRDYTMEGDRPKHPGYIRRVTACAAGLLVVGDQPNPSISGALQDDQAQKTYLYDKYPFVLANSITEAGNLWGSTDVEQLDQMQSEINKTMSQIAYHKDQAVRPKLILPKDCGVPREHVTNVHGILEPSSSMAAQGIRFLEAQNNVADMMQVFTLYKEMFFQVGGTFELDQANSTGSSVIAYKAIASLLERAATMMRGKIRSYSKLIRERGRMYVSHLQNFYTEDRWITYAEAGETHSMPIRGTEMIVPSRLTVVSGSTMPTSRIQQREEALELFKMGVIDQEEILEKIDWSGRAAVLQRMQGGPIGDVLDRMANLGMPQEMVQMLGELVQMDRKDFDKALEAGELPMMGQPPSQEMAMALSKIQAEIGKLQAETQAVMATIGAKATVEEVQRAGMQYDSEKLEIDRIKALGQARAQQAKTQIDAGRAMTEARYKGHAAPGPERGLKSNNKKLMEMPQTDTFRAMPEGLQEGM